MCKEAVLKSWAHKLVSLSSAVQTFVPSATISAFYKEDDFDDSKKKTDKCLGL